MNFDLKVGDIVGIQFSEEYDWFSCDFAIIVDVSDFCYYFIGKNNNKEWIPVAFYDDEFAKINPPKYSILTETEKKNISYIMNYLIDIYVGEELKYNSHIYSFCNSDSIAGFIKLNNKNISSIRRLFIDLPSVKLISFYKDKNEKFKC